MRDLWFPVVVFLGVILTSVGMAGINHDVWAGVLTLGILLVVMGLIVLFLWEED